ncbi:MAG: phosphatase PAP2 family protein [Candidatus Vogelbacteria bacterium]|nr:phosphatase PAP2 family protein [Candidatus Vogelbacteria bacterium]
MNELIFRYLYTLATESVWLKPVVIFVGVYLGWLILGWLSVIFIRRFREKPEALSQLFFAGGTAAGAWLAAQVIKLIWPIARPFVKLADITPLITVGDQGSFPSGHATFFFALALAVYAVDQRLGKWLMAGAAAISLARVIAGVHWPADILGGLVLAVFVVPLALFFTRLFQPDFGRGS